MKQVTSAPADFLADLPGQLICPDCFTLTLRTGQSLFYTNADVPVTVGGIVFAANSIRIDGLKYRIACGVDVDEQDISIAATDADTILGVPFLQAMRSGVLDGATLRRDRVFLAGWTQAAIGSVTLFQGRISTIQSIGRTEAQVKVKSDLVLLNIDFPRNLWSASCLHTLFDGGCTLNKADFAVTGSAASGSSVSSILWDGAADGQYDQGTISFSIGPNAGVSRNIKHSDGTKLVLSYPLDNPPGVGDGFTAYPGCDHTLGAGGCAKFANLAHFRGFPYVPPPETGV